MMTYADVEILSSDTGNECVRRIEVRGSGADPICRYGCLGRLKVLM